MYEPNKIYKDDFGRISGIFLYNKPIGITSHDVVDLFRKKIGSRDVGHAGALDPFASGLVIILVGKALKESDSFLNLDKDYEASVLFGVTTDSLDVEGEVQSKNENLKPKTDHSIQILTSSKFTQDDIKNVLTKFQPGYSQSVPIFSSVKVGGRKLRELARSSTSFHLENKEDGKYAIFEKILNPKSEILIEEVKIPTKEVKLSVLELRDLIEVEFDNLNQYIDKNYFEKFISQLKMGNDKYSILNLFVTCSKGTYIRQLAYDIGEKLGVPSMLVALKRTRIGEYDLNNDIDLNLFDS